MKRNTDKNNIIGWQGSNDQPAQIMQQYDKKQLNQNSKPYNSGDNLIHKTGKYENPVLHDMFGALNY